MMFDKIIVAAGLFIVTGSLHMLSGLIEKSESPVNINQVRSLDITKEANEWAENRLKGMTLEDKIGQFFMVAAQSNGSEKQLSDVDKLISDFKIGGVIFFQGEKENLIACSKRFQDKSDTPLLFAMDAEWGSNMRLFDGERYPYAYTIGAMHDTTISKKVAEAMALEMRSLGMHLSFSPVADVNNNPNNPVIGFRSFGGDKDWVSNNVGVFVDAFESKGVMSCVKHFPGHGNTDKDSHLELPTVSEKLEVILNEHIPPFEEGMNAGVPSVMMAHLRIPSLDESGMPMSLSKKVINDMLKTKMNYQGLVISDALNMKAVSDLYGKTEVVVKAFEAGCDVLLYPESVSDAIAAIKNKVLIGEIKTEEIDRRCKKILIAKYKYVISPTKVSELTEGQKNQIKSEVYEKATTVLRNNGNLLPLRSLDKKIAVVSIGTKTASFHERFDLFADADYFSFYTSEEAITKCGHLLKNYDLVVTSIHANSVKSKLGFGYDPSWSNWVDILPDENENILVLYGNPLVLSEKQLKSNVDALVVAYENVSEAQLAATQLIFGSIPATGKLPIAINAEFPIHAGISYEWSGRLKYAFPEELGIDAKKLNGIDSIVQIGLDKGAFPGCQIVVAVQGKIIYRKSFGSPEFNSTVRVTDTDVYDIASISKIAGSTLGMMKLQTDNLFNPDNTLSAYIPNIVNAYPSYAKINIRDMMTHQAGLKPFIQFYKETLSNGKPDSKWYSETNNGNFSIPVAKNLFMRSDFVDSMYSKILRTPLAEKKYEYSDLGYYFVKKIVEKQSGTSFQEFLMENLYRPMGLRYMRFLPLNYFNESAIMPTQLDNEFRGQLLRGYVHDPGAAMLGGVGGHAGIFANATDLASLMQLFLNKGMYGNVNYLSSNVVDQYTCSQFPGNRRGIGFDRPKANGGGTCHEMASQASYGHSGFTGTLAWVDPKFGVNYVFLSNRVCPDQENWKIRDMNIRTEIQRVIYEAVVKK